MMIIIPSTGTQGLRFVARAEMLPCLILLEPQKSATPVDGIVTPVASQSISSDKLFFNPQPAGKKKIDEKIIQ